MVHHWSEGVSPLRLTPREYQHELVEEAVKHNLLSCPPSSAASFVSLKVIQELAHQIRKPKKRKTVSLAPVHRLRSTAIELSHLTDLQIIALASVDDCSSFDDILNNYEVLVCSYDILEYLLITDKLKMEIINLLVIEQCHMIMEDVHLQKIMSIYLEYESSANCTVKPRILAFTYPLFTPCNEVNNKMLVECKRIGNKYTENYSRDVVTDRSLLLDGKTKSGEVELECLKDFTSLSCLEVDKDSIGMNSFQFWHPGFEDIPIETVNVENKDANDNTGYDMIEYHIEKLESRLRCKADMAADIVGLKRITGKPKEVIIECKMMLEEDKSQERINLEKFMRTTVVGALLFLKDHRYDPTEIYGEETFSEELQDIPDPCRDPREMLELFLYVLEQAGPYAADKAAYSLLLKVEKLKIKIPYERHFLLLCLITSVFLQIRAAAELIFDQYPTEKERVNLFTTPKVLRLMDILRLFKPAKMVQKYGDKNKLQNNCNVKHSNVILRNETISSQANQESTPCAKINLSNSADPDDHKTDRFKSISDGSMSICEDTSSSISDVKLSDSKNFRADNILKEINECDFKSLEKKIELNCDVLSCKPNQEATPRIGESKVKHNEIVKSSPTKKIDGNFRGRGRGKGGKGHNYQNRYNNNNNDPDALCGLIFVEEPLIAKILFTIINEFSRNDPELRYICVQYSIDKIADPLTDPKEAEVEHKNQEEVLKRFRTHECNLLIGTSFLEEGMDLPKCNLVVRWDIPDGYRSYARCRARARAPRSLYALLASASPEPLINTLAEYAYIERMLVKKCGWREPPASEEADAVRFSPLLETYRPSDAAVDLAGAVALLNRYCAKLPSDTFTRLVPLWTMERILYRGVCLYVCAVRLPINCPLKHQIVGHPMPNRVLARRVAALQACRALHKVGELDDNLMPIGKEGFRAMESDWLSIPPLSDLPQNSLPALCIGKSSLINQNDAQGAESACFEPRPGTTKRKQYYYKKVAQALSGCRPALNQPCLAYQIKSWLACPLPERHNTRGRKLHPPEDYAEGFAILTYKPIQQIPVFPIFTRSGEVRVSLQKLPGAVTISRRRQKLIHNFMKYTFADVLRVHNHLMVFDEDGKQKRNSFYIVPTIKDSAGNGKINIDWNFLQLIYDQSESDALPVNKEKYVNNQIREFNAITEYKNIINAAAAEVIDNGNSIDVDQDKIEDLKNEVCNRSELAEEEEILPNPYLASGETFAFDSEKFRDAVVMPWYRNQDQPQYFYVAEICWHLTPRSAFPSTQHATFEQYYRRKYGVRITQPTQPLLDVDHTSARLNLLTPRFVNRKGVALPTSSERTKRAKRESLEQKQILVPELCCAHPFRGALWRAAVALPCVLYRINSLLLADEIRRSVALCVGVGTLKQEERFEWPALDFGWSLAEVLAGDNSKDVKSEESTLNSSENNDADENKTDAVDKSNGELTDESKATNTELKEKSANELLKEKNDAVDEDSNEMFEIGTWSNDMAASVPENPDGTDCDDDELLKKLKLPDNLTICPSMEGGADWSLSGIETPPRNRTPPRSSRKYSMADSDASYVSSDYESSDGLSNRSDSDSDDVDINVTALDTLDSEKGGLRIEFKSGNEAEAIEIEPVVNSDKSNTDENLESNAKKEADEKSMTSFKNLFYNHKIEDAESKRHLENFQKCITVNKANLIRNDILIPYEKNLNYLKKPLSLPNKNEVDPSVQDAKLDVPSIKVNSVLNSSNDVEDFIEDDDANPFPELQEMALSKTEILGLYNQIFAYDPVKPDEHDWLNSGVFENGVVTIAKLEKNKRKILDEIKASMPREEWSKYNFFSMKDLDVESLDNSSDKNHELPILQSGDDIEEVSSNFSFSFDYQPNLYNHPGPSPSLILQALTMSNANDGINLERLETIGDSFLKYAITTYLYCTYQNIHEGKLSHLRSKQVSNLNLYRLGRRKSLGSRMVAYKFEPYDNWLPPCHRVPPHLERALIDTHIPSSLWNIADMPPLIGLTKEEIERLVKERVAHYHAVPPKSINGTNKRTSENCPVHGESNPKINGNQCNCQSASEQISERELTLMNLKEGEYVELEGVPCFVPYNLITQHSIPDKSIADCVEALIGAYLIECGPRGALLFMAWLGIRVLPREEVVLSSDHPFVKMMESAEISKETSVRLLNIDGPIDADDQINEESIGGDDVEPDASEQDPYDNQDDNSELENVHNWNWEGRIPGSLKPEKNEHGQWIQVIYGELKSPPSPLLRNVPDPEGELMQMLSGYEGLERTLGYRFKDRCYLLQAMTHASYSPNRLTDCYQRLEFLGDAVLDYLITRQLYEDPRRHSPGALTDLRSALVNNTIFASLAVRHGMHKYFRHLSPGLNEVIARFVKIQEENGHSISEEDYLIQEDECEQAEDVEVPKALGDLFESIAGAIFLDSGMSLDAVWKVYHALMKREIEAFSESVPKSPVRELLEMEPETAKFGKPEKLADGRRVRVTVEVLGVGVFKGVGRNYRIAKCTAAKCALRRLLSTNTRRHKNKG